MQIVVLDIFIIQKNFSKVNIIESHEDVNKCTFSTSWFTNQSNVVSGVDGQIKSF